MVQGKVLVYRGRNHLTATFMRQLTPTFRRMLTALIPPATEDIASMLAFADNHKDARARVVGIHGIA